MAAPWYRRPPSQPPTRPNPADRPSRWFLGAVGACAALGVFLVLSDPAATQTSSQARWDTPPVRAAAVPAADAADAAREERAARFAAIDEALGAAAAGSRLAALEAHDVALRAFAAQQATRYDELRSALRAIAGESAVGAAAADLAGEGRAPVVLAASDLGAAGATDGVANGDGIGALHAERLAALREAEGPEFDLLYVGQALALNRALLAELDAALATIEDVELRDAVERVRGSIDAAMPARDPGARGPGAGEPGARDPGAREAPPL